MDSAIQEVKFKVHWKEIHEAPIIMPYYTYTPTLTTFDFGDEVEIKKCELTVYLQGKLPNSVDGRRINKIENDLVILTVHDVGANPHSSFIKFVNSPAMADFLKEKSSVVFLHVCVPGQEPEAKEFVENFPTMQHLAQILPQVLEHFGIKRCIGMGEGAGADVVYRFASFNPEMVSGVVLIHCTSTTHGFVENLKEMIANLRIEEGKMSESAWDYLMTHKLGHKQTIDSKARFIDEIRQLGLNEHNLSQYLHAFANREELQLELFCPSKFHCILVTGGKSPHNKNIFHMYEHMDKSKTGLIVAEGVVDIQKEAPEYIAMALTDLLQAPNLPKNLKMSEGTEQSNAKNEEHLPSEVNKNQMDECPPSLSVPPKKPILVIGCPATIKKNPTNSSLATESINSANSSGRISNFECAHCGKECRWCAKSHGNCNCE